MIMFMTVECSIRHTIEGDILDFNTKKIFFLV